MDSTHDQELPGDLSALAWVQDELRRTLDNAHKSLRRQLRNQELQPAETPTPASHPALQQARNLIHQGVGALELIGQVSAARVLRASEQVVQRIDRGELLCEAATVDAVEKASFAVLDFLGRQLAGRAPSELGLFPQYREVMGLAGAERIHPSDLWEAMPVLPAAAPAAVPVPGPRVRQAVEARLLKYLRGDVAAARRMSDAFAQLGERAEGRLGLAWRLASAFFEAQAQGLLPPDLLAKRLASRLLVQLRAVERGVQDCPDRLLQDLLFFCARARRDDAQAPRLSQVARQCALPALDGADYEHSPLGRYDPALVPQARRRVAALKESWSLVAAGELASLASLHEQTAQVGESIRQIYQDGERLAQALQAATESAVQAGRGPSPELAMEVATTLLCLDASLDEADPEHPDLQDRIQQVAQRLEMVTAGGSAPPLEPWVEALYRDVSDRQSMGSVVQELRATLAEIEQQLDRFNRNADEREALTPVPNQFNAMRGVLSVLGLDQAAQAVQRMRDDVAAVLAQDADASRATDQLADNLGALSFLIDMLGVQPQLAKALFRFDPSTGRFAALMGRAKAAAKPVEVETALLDQVQTLARSAEQEEVSTEDLHRHLEGLADQAVAADQPDVAQVVSQAREALAQAQDAQAEEAARADVVQALAALATPPAPPAAMPSPSPAGDDDDDMREIFLEEAREVLEQAREGLSGLRADAGDLEAMTTVRRAFHTLKGSSRMVGLTAFGEAAWACEQLFNARLAEAVVRADEPLCDFTGRALDQLEDWIGRVAEGQDDAPQGTALMAEAQALRLGGQGAVAQAVPDLAVPSEASPIDVPEVSEAIDASAAWAAATMPLPVLDEALTESPLPAPEADPHLIDLDLDLDAGTEPAAALPDLDLDLSFDAPAPTLATGEEPVRLSLLELPADLRDVVATGEVEDEAPTTAEPPPDLAGGLSPSWSDTQVDEAAEPVPAPTPLPREEPVLLEAWVSEELHERVSGPQEEPASFAPSTEPLPLVDSVAEQAEVPVEPSASVVPQEDDAERYKVVGPLRIQIALFNIYLNEADEQSRRLSTELSEWQLELDRPVGETAVALAHSLAGNSATVGFQDLSNLARRLEHALERSQARGRGEAAEAELYLGVAEEIRRLLHQFAAGFLKPVQTEVLERLSAHEHDEVQLTERLAKRLEANPGDAEGWSLLHWVNSSIREQFPLLSRQIDDQPIVYLDSANTSQKPRAVIDAMSRFMEHGYAPINRSAYRLAAEATDAYGLATLSLKVDTDAGIHIQRQMALQVQPAFPPEHEIRRFKIDAGGEAKVDVGPVDRFFKGSVMGSVAVSNQPPMNVKSLVKGLFDYPYGCLEQTTSAAYPHLMLDEASAKAMGLTFPAAAERQRFVEGAIARLAGMQKQGGGFGLWNSQSEHEFWLSAYVTGFLREGGRIAGIGEGHSFSVGGPGAHVRPAANDRSVRRDQHTSHAGIGAHGTAHLGGERERLGHERLVGHRPSFRAREGTPDIPARRFLPSGL